jgi:hypothetical protein
MCEKNKEKEEMRVKDEGTKESIPNLPPTRFSTITITRMLK